MAQEEDEDIFDPVTPAQRQGSFLDRPGIRSALLQAGLQLLQPTRPGTSPAGNIASAIASGGEAFQRANAARTLGRRQKASELETESTLRNRESAAKRGETRGGSLGAPRLTLSQRMRAQSDERKEFEKFLEREADDLVASNPDFASQGAAMDFLASDAQKAATIEKFKRRRGLAAEATGQNTRLSAEDVKAADPLYFATLQQGLAAGDPRALSALQALRAGVVDPENLDALLGVSGGGPNG